MQAKLKGNFVTMSYIILPKAVQLQPVRCNSSMQTCQGQVWAPEHYYIYVGVAGWEMGLGVGL